MTRTDLAGYRHGVWRTAIALTVVVSSGLCWRGAWAGDEGVAEATSRPSIIAAEPVSYPAPGKEPSIRMESPVGAEPLSGPEIRAALSDHTALLPGGFIEYYAPDGTLHGLTEEKHYGGSWEVRNGTFCTLLEGGDSDVCSPVEREGGTLYWSVDGEKEASPVATIQGNPRNLQ
jgi:hypothetical protein